MVLAVEILVQHTHKWNLSHLDTFGWKKVSHSVKCSVKLYVNMVFETAKFIEVGCPDQRGSTVWKRLCRVILNVKTCAAESVYILNYLYVSVQLMLCPLLLQ